MPNYSFARRLRFCRFQQKANLGSPFRPPARTRSLFRSPVQSLHLPERLPQRSAHRRTYTTWLALPALLRLACRLYFLTLPQQAPLHTTDASRRNRRAPPPPERKTMPNHPGSEKNGRTRYHALSSPPQKRRSPIIRLAFPSPPPSSPQRQPPSPSHTAPRCPKPTHPVSPTACADNNRNIVEIKTQL